jgi:hypothetical protein
MDPDRTPYTVLYYGQNKGETNTKKKSKYETIGMIRQNGLIQEDDDDDERATCSYCYFNNYMTNM